MSRFEMPKNGYNNYEGGVPDLQRGLQPAGPRAGGADLRTLPVRGLRPGPARQEVPHLPGGVRALQQELHPGGGHREAAAAAGLRGAVQDLHHRGVGGRQVLGPEHVFGRRLRGEHAGHHRAGLPVHQRGGQRQGLQVRAVGHWRPGEVPRHDPHPLQE